MNPKEVRKNIGLNGMFKIRSHKAWTLDGSHIYCISLPELMIDKIKSFLINRLRAMGFFARICGCGSGVPVNEIEVKFRLFQCRHCFRPPNKWGVPNVHVEIEPEEAADASE
jgi:hypothetical protein